MSVADFAGEIEQLFGRRVARVIVTGLPSIIEWRTRAVARGDYRDPNGLLDQLASVPSLDILLDILRGSGFEGTSRSGNIFHTDPLDMIRFIPNLGPKGFAPIEEWVQPGRKAATAIYREQRRIDRRATTGERLVKDRLDKIARAQRNISKWRSDIGRLREAWQLPRS